VIAIWNTIRRLDTSNAARFSMGKLQMRCIMVGTKLTQLTLYALIQSKGLKRIEAIHTDNVCPKDERQMRHLICDAKGDQKSHLERVL
jgi:hypothetical protein